MFDRKAYMKEYRQKHKKEHAAEMRIWRAENPEKVKAINHAQYERRKKAKADGKKESQSST